MHLRVYEYNAHRIYISILKLVEVKWKKMDISIRYIVFKGSENNLKRCIKTCFTNTGLKKSNSV
jgi:hypothetical protein